MVKLGGSVNVSASFGKGESEERCATDGQECRLACSSNRRLAAVVVMVVILQVLRIIIMVMVAGENLCDVVRKGIQRSKPYINTHNLIFPSDPPSTLNSETSAMTLRL
jgi:hypothetical protein